MAIGTGVALQLGQITTLECDRRLNRCEIKRQSWLNQNRQTFAALDLQAAFVAAKPVEIPSDRLERSNEMYRVVLTINNGEVPLTGYYSSDRQPKSALVAEINTFLLNPERLTLTVQQDNRLNAYIAGGICAIVGLVIMASSWRG
ncbi:MAG: hypothetical protein SAJ12_17005 [Jaaginema sp. PMC 1079.18]|nr:hypothetical protein [Jaaginema sp. PMC 1080.18]MEC4852681.1 hypothetical protein [Jaaginema sp. PMC 1079.18]MEC4868396.1 hypothetical protein [Jaaginema sp. PMC 1078.18]